MKDIEEQIAKSPESQMIISMLSNTYSFDSRFDRMQSRIDEMSKNQVTMQQQLDKVSINQDVMQKQMDNFQEQLRDIKFDMDRRFTETRVDMLDRFAQVDKRFEQVDKRFEQVDKQLKKIVEKIDERFDRFDEKFDKIGQILDYRDDRQRKFTLRMFSIAISISSFSVVGVLLKIINYI